PSARAGWLAAAGAAGLILFIVQGFAIGLDGWRFEILDRLFGPGPRQAGMGAGAAATAAAFLILLCHGLAARGWCRGDGFVTSAIGVVVALIATFVFFPISTILVSAFADEYGGFSPFRFVLTFADRSIW